MGLHRWSQLRLLRDTRDQALHLLLPGTGCHPAVQVRLNALHRRHGTTESLSMTPVRRFSVATQTGILFLEWAIMQTDGVTCCSVLLNTSRTVELLAVKCTTFGVHQNGS